MATERTRQLKSYLETILPEHSLEAAADAGMEIETAAADAGVAPDAARVAVEKLAMDRDLTPEEQFAVEAIVIPDKRPAIDILNGDYSITHALWTHFDTDADIRARLRKAIPSVGRIELPGHPSAPYGGTGFVVGEGLLMTNRHVAEIFASGWGIRGLAFRPGLAAGIDFRKERDGNGSQMLDVTEVVMIHPYWDMALLRVQGLPAAHTPLVLSTKSTEDAIGGDVAVIGYPAFSPYNDANVQNEVFRGVYNIKRLQPGKLAAGETIKSFGKMLRAAVHDSSTLGGNSGSAVIEASTGEVIALHFAGTYLKANYAVPASELARDGRVIDAGVRFAPGTGPKPTDWDDWWQKADSPEESAAPSGRPAASGAVTVTIPLEVSVRLIAPALGVVAAMPQDGGAPQIEKLVEPIHDPDYASRTGYDPSFLGITVPLPKVTDLSIVATLDNGDHIVPYHHFSLVMHKLRRLALLTGCNVDAAPQSKRPAPGKGYSRDQLGGLGKNDTELWFTDPRLPEMHQLPDRFFSKDRGAFDRGHLVRREDVAWGGSYDEVRYANGDTFHTTNCSPQVAGFNRADGESNWGELEKDILEQAETERLCLFSGPVLLKGDLAFVGVDAKGAVRLPIPSRYWKVVVARAGRSLQSFAFLLAQDLDDVPLEYQVAPKWRRQMTSVAQLEKLLGVIQFPAAVRRADQAHESTGEAVREAASIELVA